MNEWMKYLLFLNRKLQFALSQINEWTNEWMNKWMNEWNIFYFLTESYNLLSYYIIHFIVPIEIVRDSDMGLLLTAG